MDEKNFITVCFKINNISIIKMKYLHDNKYSLNQIMNRCIKMALYDWNNRGFMHKSKCYIRYDKLKYTRKYFKINTDDYTNINIIASSLEKSVPIILEDILYGYYSLI